MTTLQVGVPTIIFQGTDDRIVANYDGKNLAVTFEKTDGQDAMGVTRWQEVPESDAKKVFAALIGADLAAFGFEIDATAGESTTTN